MKVLTQISKIDVLMDPREEKNLGKWIVTDTEENTTKYFDTYKEGIKELNR